jgi:hypothetical protein
LALWIEVDPRIAIGAILAGRQAQRDLLGPMVVR